MCIVSIWKCTITVKFRLICRESAVWLLNTWEILDFIMIICEHHRCQCWCGYLAFLQNPRQTAWDSMIRFISVQVKIIWSILKQLQGTAKDCHGAVNPDGALVFPRRICLKFLQMSISVPALWETRSSMIR